MNRFSVSLTVLHRTNGEPGGANGSQGQRMEKLTSKKGALTCRTLSR